MHMIEAVDVTFGYDPNVLVLKGCSFVLAAGESVAVMGPSGSGKSTMLGLAAGVLRPQSGSLFVDGLDMSVARNRDCVRSSKVAWIQQTTNLLTARSALDNVALAMRTRGARWSDAVGPSQAALEAMGLAAQVGSRAGRLSGGQAQRVCVARALVTRPDFVLADEPTGQLDAATSQQVMAALVDAVADFGTSLLLATHDVVAAQACDRVIEVHDGLVRT